MKVKNICGFDFKFRKHGVSYTIPDDGEVHELSDNLGIDDFGGYLEIVEPASKQIYKKSPIYKRGSMSSTGSIDFGGDSFERQTASYMSSTGGTGDYTRGLVPNEDIIRSSIYGKRVKSISTQTGDDTMAEEARGDLILAPGQYAYVQDTNTGNVSAVVGPIKKTMENTEVAVKFNNSKSDFERCRVSESIRQFPAADEQSYIVLQNPVRDDKGKELISPKEGMVEKRVQLENGRSVNINGPIRFALWPGQIATVVPGHQLRSNQYLVARVVNADEAMKNEGTIQKKEGASDDDAKTTKAVYVTGQLIIIKGTNVSFYIPPTGMEVVPDENGKYIRDALTLETLEYCVLKDENGDKRYERGPAVVFPKPTETFIERSGGSKIFKAVELNENMGLYIKVIADYKEGDKVVKAGEELFVSGRHGQKIYFPKPEHAIIKYGKQMIHYAVAIPEGDARYVLDKRTGKVSLRRGEEMFLPDPRTDVIVKRILDPRDVELMFPGNKEAISYNMKAATELPYDGYMPSADRSAKKTQESAGHHSRSTMRFTDEEGIEEFAEGMKRQTSFTPPRTITIDSKYEGAVNINIWPGFAVQIVNKKGERRVVKGPQAVLLEYDETLEKLMLSTGNPKSDTKLMHTAYLNVQNNKVSDTVDAVTSDMVNVKIRVSYRVNFLDEYQDKWFAVQNYTKLLTEHLRSIIRNAVKKIGIEELNDNSIDIIRDTILGVKDAKGESKKRAGRIFEENGMHVYDVEVLNMRIDDDEIQEILWDHQRQIVGDDIKLKQTRKRLEVIREQESANQIMIDLQNATTLKKIDADISTDARNQARNDAISKAEIARQKDMDIVAKHDRDRKTADDLRRIDRMGKQADIITQAHVKRFEAMNPSLVSAINSLADTQLATKLAENLPKASGTQGLLFGAGGMDGLKKLVVGTRLEKALQTINDKIDESDGASEHNVDSFNNE